MCFRFWYQLIIVVSGPHFLSDLINSTNYLSDFLKRHWFIYNKINCNSLSLFKYLSEQRANKLKWQKEWKGGRKVGKKESEKKGKKLKLFQIHNYFFNNYKHLDRYIKKIKTISKLKKSLFPKNTCLGFWQHCI